MQEPQKQSDFAILVNLVSDYEKMLVQKKPVDLETIEQESKVEIEISQEREWNYANLLHEYHRIKRINASMNLTKEMIRESEQISQVPRTPQKIVQQSQPEQSQAGYQPPIYQSSGVQYIGQQQSEKTLEYPKTIQQFQARPEKNAPTKKLSYDIIEQVQNQITSLGEEKQKKRLIASAPPMTDLDRIRRKTSESEKSVFEPQKKPLLSLKKLDLKQRSPPTKLAQEEQSTSKLEVSDKIRERRAKALEQLREIIRQDELRVKQSVETYKSKQSSLKTRFSELSEDEKTKVRNLMRERIQAFKERENKKIEVREGKKDNSDRSDLIGLQSSKLASLALKRIQSILIEIDSKSDLEIVDWARQYLNSAYEEFNNGEISASEFKIRVKIAMAKYRHVPDKYVKFTG